MKIKSEIDNKMFNPINYNTQACIIWDFVIPN